VRRRSRLGIRLPADGAFPWRAVSLLMILVLLVAGAVIFTNPIFYVRQVQIGGVRYVPAEEIFTQAGIAGFHVLWVDPSEVASRIAASPSLDSSTVIVQWPARVIILVRER
jgi:cell division septal protein FtsQ